MLHEVLSDCIVNEGPEILEKSVYSGGTVDHFVNLKLVKGSEGPLLVVSVQPFDFFD